MAELETWLEEWPEELELILVPALSMTHSLHHCRLAIIACQLAEPIRIMACHGTDKCQLHPRDPLLYQPVGPNYPAGMLLTSLPPFRLSPFSPA